MALLAAAIALLAVAIVVAALCARSVALRAIESERERLRQVDSDATLRALGEAVDATAQLGRRVDELGREFVVLRKDLFARGRM